MRVSIAADHAGFALKEELVASPSQNADKRWSMLGPVPWIREMTTQIS